MLSLRKRDCILQWFNAFNVQRGVQTLKEFADGLLFYQIIISLFPAKENGIENLQDKDPMSDVKGSVNGKDDDLPNGETNHIRTSIEGNKHLVHVDDAGIVDASISENSPCDPTTEIITDSPQNISADDAEGSNELKNNSAVSTQESLVNGTVDTENVSDVATREEVADVPQKDTIDSFRPDSSEVELPAGDESHSDLANGTCPMEVSFDENFSKLANDVNHFEDKLTNDVNDVGDKLTNDVNHVGDKLTNDVNHVGDKLTNDVNHIEENTRSEIADDPAKSTDVLSVSALPEENSGTESFDDGTFLAEAANYKQREIEKRFDAIEKFIDGILMLKSDELVNYSDCIKGVELELAKVAVLFLSAWLQCCLSSESVTAFNTICHLNQDIQEEIKECAELFLTERLTPVKKKEFSDLLSHTAARARCSPRWSASVTPQQEKKRQAKKGRSRKKVNIIEDKFVEYYSPLKSFLESPDIRHITPKTKQAVIQEAVSNKNKEISQLIERLEEERDKIIDLEEKNKDLNFELLKLREEKDKLKEKHNEQGKCWEEAKELLLKEKEELEKEKMNLKHQIEDLESDLKFLTDQDQHSENDIEDSDRDSKFCPLCKRSSQSIDQCLQMKEARIKTLEKNIENLYNRLNEAGALNVLKAYFEELGNIEDQQDFLKRLKDVETFRIVDLAARNDLQMKVNELQGCLQEKEVENRISKEEMEAKYKELEKSLREVKKSEKDWKGKFRKADKEREDACRNWEKKIQQLIIEKERLSAEKDTYVKVLNRSANDDIFRSPAATPSHLESCASENGSVGKTNTSDSEKVGILWSTFRNDDLQLRGEGTPAASLRSKSRSRSRSNEIPQQESRVLCRSQSSSMSQIHVTDCNDTLSVEKSPTNGGKFHCTESEFRKISSLVIKLAKAIKSKSIRRHDAASLEKYERHLNSAGDLISALLLFCKILEKDLNISAHSNSRLKRKRGSSAREFENELDLKRELSDISSSNDRLLENLELKLNMIDNLNKTVSTLKDENEHLQISLSQLKDELQKKSKFQSKVTSLELMLKKFKEDYEEKKRSFEEKLTKAEDERDTAREKLKKVNNENRMLLKKLSVFENKDTINTAKVIPVNKPCECAKLREKLDFCKGEKVHLDKIKNSLTSDLKSQIIVINKLKSEVKELTQKNKTLEENLHSKRSFNPGNYEHSVFKVAEKLRKSDEKAKQVEDEWQDVPVITNVSLVPPPEKIDYDTFSLRNNNHQSEDHSIIFNMFCKPEDEAEMLSQSSIASFQYDSPSQRLKDFQRRNTLCLPHMKSVYPLELNTTPSHEKYFKVPTSTSRASRYSESDDDTTSSRQNLVKKRKIVKSTSGSVNPSAGPVSTSSRSNKPTVGSASVQKSSARKMFKTPQSFYRLVNKKAKNI